MNRRQFRALVSLFARLGRDERGGETLEYALTLGMLSLACWVLVQVVGVKFFDFWYRIDHVLALLG